jgi:hypothetical protein
MAELYRSGQHRIDFANASVFELLAFCVAGEIEDRNKMSGSADETKRRGGPGCCDPVCPKPDCLPIARIGMSRVSRLLPLAALALVPYELTRDISCEESGGCRG